MACIAKCFFWGEDLLCGGERQGALGFSLCDFNSTLAYRVESPFYPLSPPLPLFSIKRLKFQSQRAPKKPSRAPLLESWRHPSLVSGKISPRVAFEVGFPPPLPPLLTQG